MKHELGESELVLWFSSVNAHESWRSAEASSLEHNLH